MYKLDPGEYFLGRKFLGGLDIHLAAKALVEGDSPGEIFLDDKAAPQSMFARTMKRCYLAGKHDNQQFNQQLKQLFVEEFFPRGINKGERGFSLFYAPGEWEPVIPEHLLDEIYPQDRHHYYRCKKLSGNWRRHLPGGYNLVKVDKALLENEALGSYADLIEEIHSECQSVPEFLEHRFGYCILQGDQIITWCLSEYNSGGRCEVGIATHPDHRRKGLATAASLALVEKALGMDYHEVGWHCYAGNEGSIATALSAGFEFVSDYPAFWVSYDRAIAMGVQGNQRFERQAYQEAVEWYLRAIAEKSAPAWVYWNTACAFAHLDEQEKSFEFLHRAVDEGFTDSDHIKNSPHFAQWHGSEEWESLLKRL